MIYVHPGSLSAGLTKVNDRLQELCGGERLVYFPTLQDWVYDPSTSVLEYRVRDDAPEEAIEKADELVRRWSRAQIQNFPADRPCEANYRRTPPPRYEFNLWLWD